MLGDMLDADVAQIVIGFLGLLAAGIAAFFAWRDWDRGRSRWTIELRTDTRPKRFGELQREKAAYITCIVSCRRNTIRVERIELRRDKRSVPLRMNRGYPQLAPPATLQVGNSVREAAVSDDLAVYHRGPNGPLREVCWIDAEGHAHCQKIPAEPLDLVLRDSRI